MAKLQKQIKSRKKTAAELKLIMHLTDEELYDVLTGAASKFGTSGLS